MGRHCAYYVVMNFHRINVGYYQASQAGTVYTVHKNSETGFWQLLINDEWAQSFCTKWEAVEAAHICAKETSNEPQMQT